MSSSKLEQRFLTLWQALTDVPIQQEFKAIPGRRYSFDFYIPSANTLVEIQGATWMPKGAHNTGNGIRRDCEKANAATYLGYHTFAFTGAMVTKANVQELVNFCQSLTKA